MMKEAIIWQKQKQKLVEETGVPGESHRPATSHGQTLTHNVHDHGHDGPLWLNENILFNMSQIYIQPISLFLY